MALWEYAQQDWYIVIPVVNYEFNIVFDNQSLLLLCYCFN